MSRAAGVRSSSGRASRPDPIGRTPAICYAAILLFGLYARRPASAQSDPADSLAPTMI